MSPEMSWRARYIGCRRGGMIYQPSSARFVAWRLMFISIASMTGARLWDFKVCPLCKNVRYCGAACRNEDWTTDGHKATCGITGD
jgi:hypothetical protein